MCFLIRLLMLGKAGLKVVINLTLFTSFRFVFFFLALCLDFINDDIILKNFDIILQEKNRLHSKE